MADTTRPDTVLLPLGEALLPEHLELAYFAATIVGVAPEQLRLSHLVRHLREGSGHLRRRSSDATENQHGASCGCAICATTRTGRAIHA